MMHQDSLEPENEEQPSGFVGRILKEQYNKQTINS